MFTDWFHIECWAYIVILFQKKDISENEIDENNFESFAYICFTLIRSAL